MEKYRNGPWERLKKVIEASGARSTNAFAKLIELDRPEILYRIKRGENSISKALAERICSHFPHFEHTWLLYGSYFSFDNLMLETNNRLVSLPLLRDIRTRETTDKIYLPEALKKGADLALLLENDLFYPMICKGVVALFKRSEIHIAYGSVHLACTAKRNILCTIRENSGRGKVLLAPLMPKDSAEIIIDRCTIKELYVICGVYII